MEKSGHTRIYWNCKCDCGNFRVSSANNLIRSSVKSCGCLQKENKSNLRHGLHNTKVYNAWRGIKDRCFNLNSKVYKNYGGRGITMFPAWIDNFLAFYNYVSTLEHFGEVGYSLDRIDNNGNYEPDNLRWADRKTQNRNKRNNHLVEYNGVEMSLAEASELSGIKASTLLSRLYNGNTGDELFCTVKS